MALMPALVRALAETTSRDRASLDNVVSEARRAGILSPTKRGFGATAVSGTDAANLLIAAFGTDSAKQIPELVPQYRSLRRWGLDPRTPMHEYRLAALAEGQADPFAALDAAPDFGQALETLIDNALPIFRAMVTALHLEVAESVAPENLEEQRSNVVQWAAQHFRVAFRRFPTVAVIRLEIRPQVEWIFRPVPELGERGFYTEPTGDDQIERSIGFKTVLHVAGCIAADQVAPDIVENMAALVRDAGE